MVVGATNRRPSRHRLVAAVLTAAAALLLTACGARVDTGVRLDKGSESGTRVMWLTLGNGDLGSVTGGVDALDASVRTHVPAELQYTGITAVEDGVRAEFLLPFASPAEYQAKLAAVLSAGGVTAAPQVELTSTDSLFSEGVHLAESGFAPTDLFAWLTDGLIADGVVAESDRSNVLEAGQNYVDYDGRSNAVSAPITFDEGRDDGLRAVSLSTKVADDGTLRRSVEYVMTQDSYAHDAAGFDAFFASAVPDGGTVSERTPHDDGTLSWSVEFTATTDDELTAKTDQALGAAGSVFTLESTPSSDNPVRIQNTIVDRATCTAICSLTAGPVTSDLTVPAAWFGYSSTLTETGTGPDGRTFQHIADGTPETLYVDIPFDSIAIDTAFGWRREVTTTLTFTVANTDVDRADGGFETLLTPAEDVGTFTSSRGDALTTYTVVLTGKDADELTSKLSRYLPGASLGLAASGSDGFFHTSFVVEQRAHLTGTLVPGAVTHGFTYTVHAPWGHVVTVTEDGPDAHPTGEPAGSAAGADPADPTAAALWSADEPQAVYLDVQGTPLSAWIFYGVAALLGLALAVTAVVLRRRLARAATRLRRLPPWVRLHVARWRERRRARAASLATVAGAYVPTQADGPRIPAGVGVPRTSDQQFSEADLL